MVALIYNFQLDIQVDSQNELFFGLAESRAADQNFLILPLIVALVVGLLATLALPLGPLLKSMPPLRAYAIDIGGSMAGIALFAALSAFGTSPPLWFGIAAVLVIALDIGRGLSRWTFINVALLLVVVAGVFNHAALRPQEIWSPYYRISSFKATSGLEHITVDAYGDEGYWSFAQAIEDSVRFPFTASLVGAPVDVTGIDFDGDERRGLVAAVERDGTSATISILDLDLTTTAPPVARIVTAYRHWLGIP